ncbi:MAG: hypothetical protein MJ204_00370 [Bacteroidales bacterium]|nr:hypothetical protein [Bacteroidales bacterium]
MKSLNFNLKCRTIFLMVWGMFASLVSVGQVYQIVPEYNISSVEYLSNCSGDGIEVFKLSSTNDWAQKFYVSYNGVKDNSWNNGDQIGKDDNYWNGSAHVGKMFNYSVKKGTTYIRLDASSKTISRLTSTPACDLDWSKSITVESRAKCSVGELNSCGSDKVWFSLACTEEDGGGGANVGFRIKLGDDELGNSVLTSNMDGFNSGWISWYKWMSVGTTIYLVLNKKDLTLTWQSSEPNDCGSKVTKAKIYPSTSVCLSETPTLEASYEGTGTFTPIYQWYKNGSEEISGATLSTYNPTSEGNYSVRVYATPGEESTSAISDEVSVTGPVVSTVTLASNTDAYCAGNTILTVDDDASCSPAGYPQYAWYKDGSLVATTTEKNYTIPAAGNWKVVVKADATHSKESASIAVLEMVPSITASDVSFAAEKDGVADNKTLTVSLENSCSLLKAPVLTGANASMYSVTPNGDGTYSITFTPGSTAGSFPATLTFTTEDGKVSKSISLSGHISSCVGSSISVDVNSFTIPSGDSDYEQNVAIGLIEVDQNYSVCFDITSYTGRTDWGEYTISASVNDVYVYNHKFNHRESFSPLTGNCVVVSGAVLVDNKLKVKLFRGKNEGNLTVSNIRIAKACPPEVEFASITGECDVNPSFTAEVTKGSADIKKYEWYVIEEGNPTLVATHNSSSLTDIFSQSAEIGTGKTVKVVVTDENDLQADVTYEINCGPIINPITAPVEICPDGNLSMAVPSYTTTSDIKSEGWEVAPSATATLSEWIQLSSLDNLSDYKNWYIRYYAENGVGRGKSNAVQITMFDEPVVDPIFVDDICKGEGFVLDEPNVTYDASRVSESWQYATQSDFSDATAIPATVSEADTYYIMYTVTDACTSKTVSTTAIVSNPSISVIEYKTYMRVAGTQQKVADAPILDTKCVGTLVYTITSGNTEYFTIDAATGVITMTAEATVKGDYPLTVTIYDASTNTTVTYDVMITLTEEPTMSMECPTPSDVYVYTNYQKTSLETVVTSNFVNEDVQISVSGSAATYFDITPTTVEKNTANVPVQIEQNKYFTGVGDYTLKLTATTESLSQECEVKIHTKQLQITEYINDQTNCSRDASSLIISVTGEDPNLPISYQWYKVGTPSEPVVGATSSTFKPTEDGGYYGVVMAGGSEIYSTTVSNVFFVKDVPTLTFKTEVPTEIFCTEELGVEMEVTSPDDEDVTIDYKRFWWLNGSRADGLTATGVHTFTFNCEKEDYVTRLSAYIMDNASGCTILASKDVTVKKMANTYYYRGPVASDYNAGTYNKDSWGLNDPNNWCTEENGTAGSCTSPTNFTESASKYIINKDNVVLKADQTWNVSGVGSTIVVSNGFFDKSALPVAGEGWETRTNWGSYKDGQYFEFASASMNGKNQVERMTSVASKDYRDNAKVVTIEGTLNTSDNVKVDVNHGGSLTIATDKGNFDLGILVADEITRVDGNSNGYYNVCVNPGSSVTYTGDGTKNIREAVYSQVYIEPTNPSDEIIFEENAKIEVVQALTLGSNATYENIKHKNSHILYEGLVNQDIASMPYYILQIENPNDKTLLGKIDVDESFIIGAGTVLNAGEYTININGDGDDAFVFNGIFECGTSTVNYTSVSETTVAALDYYNLNLGDGNRTLETTNNIGIAGTLTASSSESVVYTIEGSTVEFNGTKAQSIPKFTFYNIVINNSAMSSNENSSSFDNNKYLRMIGDVTVENSMLLKQGILNVIDNLLYIENTAASAIGQGYFTSYTDASFIVGNIKRDVPSSLTGSDVATLYYFPVGDIDGYKPLTLSQLTTGEDASVTVGISEGVSGNFINGDSEDAFSASFSWKVSGENYTSASVGISTSQGLGEANAIAYNTITSGTFNNVYGSMYGNSILYSQPTEPGYFALAKRTITNKKYYFNCSGSVDASSIEAWWTEENGGGSRAGSFTDTDAEWIFNCGTQINGELSISGANSKVTMNIPYGQELKINSDVTFITGNIRQGTVSVTSDGILSIMYSFTMNDVSAGGSGINVYNRSAIVNNGTVNIDNSTLVLKDSWITNNGRINLTNTDLSMSSKNSGQSVDKLLENLDDDPTAWIKSQAHSCFWNYGSVVMTNGSLDVIDGSDGTNTVHILNADNAVWLIDNTTASGVKHVIFDGCELSHEGKNIAYVDMQCGSSFVVKNSDVQLLYKGNPLAAKIGGELIVQDGNLYIARSDGATGGEFTLEQTCGSIYLIDTDGSNDGILQLKGAGGGYKVNVEGTLYAMGVVESGGNGADLNVKPGGTMFIGNLGATIPAYTWNFSIKVEEEGTLYYCGNRTSGADGVGSNEGDLYYAGSFYGTRNPMTKDDASNPAGEGDFSGSGNSAPMFVGEMECMQAYREGIPDTSPSALLPIELTMLYGVCTDGILEIHWQTMSETNNAGYAILRSFDGLNFTEVGFVDGAGTTSELQDYVFEDKVSQTGLVYYKLRQTDYDGNVMETKVIAVQTCGRNAQILVKKEDAEVMFMYPESANQVVITTLTGKIVYSKTFKDVESARIALPQANGIYIISVIDRRQITSEKIVRY